MNLDELKKVNEMFFAVKGHLFPIEYTVDEMRSVYNSYFSRMWGNHEFHLHAEDFEEIWNNRNVWTHSIVEITTYDEDDISKVAHLGYD
jgi:hypothetical protein